MMDKNTLVLEMEKQGIFNARDYVRKFSRPGHGTVERYMIGEQDPITSTGNWRAAPQRMADRLNVDISVLFPESSERRQQILDELSQLEVGEGTDMTLLHCVRCPKTAEESGRPLFVLVDLTCASCPFRSELTGNRLVCNHPRAAEI